MISQIGGDSVVLVVDIPNVDSWRYLCMCGVSLKLELDLSIAYTLVLVELCVSTMVID